MHSKIKTHIFLTGATGYIGGSVLTRLLSHPRSETFRISILLRAPEKALQFRKMGIHTVVGTYEDLDLLKLHASKADIVVQCSDVVGLPAAEAILDGLKERYARTGHASSFVHTSGAETLKDDARGMHASDTIYSDLDAARLASLPCTQPHRDVDLALVDADKKGYVKTYIVLPTLIYGKAVGPLVDAGLQDPRPRCVPQLVEAALTRGRAGLVGNGANIWGHVHIMDLASLYILLVDGIAHHDPVEGGNSRPRPADSEEPPSRPRTPVILDSSYFTHGEQGFYFAENGEVNMLTIAEAVGEAMVDLGNATNPKPTPFTPEEEGAERCYREVAHTLYLDCNARCKADRARKVGWRPKKTTKDLISSVKQEIKSGSQT